METPPPKNPDPPFSPLQTSFSNTAEASVTENEAQIPTPKGESATVDSQTEQRSISTSPPSSTHLPITVGSPAAKNVADQPVTSIPLRGAWTSPLKLPSPEIPILRYNTESLLSDLDSQWPSLAAGNQIRSRRPSQAPSASKESLASLDLDRGIQSPEYPWAANMKPSVRNLHRLTNPSFMEDGTPKVCIPRQVLLEGVENQKEYIIGQFYRCSAPTGGQIHAVMSRIWGKRCRIFTRKLGESSFLFHIPDEATRQWILQRGLWHVDDCLMFVSAWNPIGSITIPEISTIPVWLTLRNIPNQLYSKKGISWIASGLGAPMLTSKPWLDPTQMGEAKILVEVKLDKPFSSKVAVEDESGLVTMVDVIYSWLPPKCANCGQLGHKATRCLGKIPPRKQASEIIAPTSASAVSTEEFVPSHTEVTPISTEVINDMLDTSATAPISTCSVPAAPVCSSSIEDVSVSENIEIILPTTTITVAETKLTKTASSIDATISSGELSPPAPYIVISTPQGVATPLVMTKVTTDAEVDLSVCRTLNNGDMFGNACNFEGSRLDLMENIQDEELATASNMRSLRGRLVKPTQKMQEMEWTTNKGRGKRGRGGRGNFG